MVYFFILRILKKQTTFKILIIINVYNINKNIFTCDKKIKQSNKNWTGPGLVDLPCKHATGNKRGTKKTF